MLAGKICFEFRFIAGENRSRELHCYRYPKDVPHTLLQGKVFGSHQLCQNHFKPNLTHSFFPTTLQNTSTNCKNLFFPGCRRYLLDKFLLIVPWKEKHKNKWDAQGHECMAGVTPGARQPSRRGRSCQRGHLLDMAELQGAESPTENPTEKF